MSLEDGFDGELWDGCETNWRDTSDNATALIWYDDAELLGSVSSIYIDAGDELENYYECMVDTDDEVLEKRLKHTR